MRFKSTILAILLLSSVSFSQSGLIQSILNEVNTDSIVYFVKELSGAVQTTINGNPYTIQSRMKNHAGNDMAMQYIKQKLDYYGYATELNTFSSTGKNVLATKIGTLYPNKKYIICAHFDDFSYSGSIIPGADDNASGTAAVLEAARILQDCTFDYTVIFALWDEEEQGLVGSEYYADQHAAANDSIVGVVNMDMIAYDGNNDSKCELHTRSVGTSLALSTKMIECNTLYGTGLTITIKNPGSTYSDHASFWFANYGAILLIEDNNEFNPYYHSANDLVQYFNIPYFVNSAKLAIATFVSLANVLTVPVELTSFAAQQVNGLVSLSWSTATELNNYGFEVEKSFDKENWTILGFVKGNGTTTNNSQYQFADRNPGNGIIYYRLRQIDFDGTSKVYGPVEVNVNIAEKFALEQNYPNPFNPSTKIKYSIPEASLVKIEIFNSIGEKISELINEYQEAGSYNIDFNAANLPSGVYVYKMNAGSFISAQKMILTK